MTAAPTSESHPLNCYRLSDSHLTNISLQYLCSSAHRRDMHMPSGACRENDWSNEHTNA